MPKDHRHAGAPQQGIRDRLIGLGASSIRKSYYPELRERIEELRQAQQYLQRVLDAISAAIFAVDADLRVTHANEGALELTGRSADELVGALMGDVFPELRRYLSGAQQALGEGRVLERRNAAAYEGRGSRYYDIVLTPVEPGVSGVVRIDDVTDRVRLDQVIVQTEKMVSLGGLAAGMAHEINNPLGGVLQGAQNLRLRLLEDKPGNRDTAREAGMDFDAVRRYAELRGLDKFLGGIIDSGKRAADIVQHMLEFSRASEARRTREDLCDVVRSALRLVHSDYGLREEHNFDAVRIGVDCDPGLPPVNVARSEIEQVLFNLVKNAVEAMSDAGTGDPAVEIVARVEGPSATISIADNGPGMPEEVRRRVFEPFFTTKAVGQGTGLGLSVSYFIVTTNHGGEFLVESRPGRGTRFLIRLPL